MKYYAHAKVNLMLFVEGKLSNNYHNLKMLNAKISLADELDITLSDINKVEYSLDELNQLENDLCSNVLNELITKFNIKERYHIYIKKNIPLGAGLGGGSCDVAAIINFIDKQHNLNLSFEEKIEIGIKYGADVPYCLIDDLAYVEGIGEKITKINYKLNKELLVIYPNIHISTKEVFENVETYSEAFSIEYISNLLKNNFSLLLYNDLEKATFKINKTLKELKESLQSYGDVVMSGSGSAMLLFYNDSSVIEEIKKKYPDYLIVNTKVI